MTDAKKVRPEEGGPELPELSGATVRGVRGKRDGATSSWWKPASVALLGAVLVVAVVDRHTAGPGGDAVDYIDSARHLTAPSRLPPGFPILLAPFTGSLGAMQTLTVVVALMLVTGIWWAAVKIGGWRAGALAAGLMLLSPSLVGGGAAVMSDKLGALLIVAALLAILYGWPRLAGVLTALSGWVRLVHVAFVAFLPRRSRVPAVAVVVSLAGWQVFAKGSLLGYTTESSWSLEHLFGDVWYELGGNLATQPNWIYFPSVLLGLSGGLIVPGVAIVGVVGLWRDRYALGVVAFNLAVYLPYYFQSARFMLPAACLLTIYASTVLESGYPRAKQQAICEPLAPPDAGFTVPSASMFT